MSRTENGRCFCGNGSAEFTGEPFWICLDQTMIAAEQSEAR